MVSLSAHCILGLRVTPAAQFRWTGGGECPPHPSRSGRISALFSKGSDCGGFLSLHRFYAWGIVAYRLSGAERDSAMRTLPKSKTCEVYCVSWHGHPGCSAAQVSRHCALLTARKRRCQTGPCRLQEPSSQFIPPVMRSESVYGTFWGLFAVEEGCIMIRTYQTDSAMVIVKSVSRGMWVSFS